MCCAGCVLFRGARQTPNTPRVTNLHSISFKQLLHIESRLEQGGIPYNLMQGLHIVPLTGRSVSYTYYSETEARDPYILHTGTRRPR